MSTLRAARAAFIFFTRIPLGGFPYSAEEWRWAPAHFPLVGLVVGALSGVALLVLAPLGSWLAAAGAVTLALVTTGAFHEDGLADSADALGGAHGRKKILEILEDSRIGTYGAAALCLSLVFRTLLLGRLLEVHGQMAEAARFGGELLLGWALVHCLSRTGPVFLMARLPYVAGEAAKGSALARGKQLRQASVAVVWAAIASALAMGLGFQGLLLVFWWGAAVVLTAVLGRWYWLRAGGYTGDFLGATEQILEIALLFVWLGWWVWGGGI